MTSPRVSVGKADVLRQAAAHDLGRAVLAHNCKHFRVDIPGDATVETLGIGMKGVSDPENPGLYMDAARIIDRAREGARGFSIARG